MGVSRFRAEELKSIAFGSVIASYAAIGAAYAFPISKIFVSNLTDAALVFSFNGTTDHFVLPADGFLLLDITMDPNTPDYLKKGDSIYVKRIGTPSSGSVYLTTFYGLNK